MNTASYTVNQFSLVDERNTALKDLLSEFSWQGEELMRLSLPLMPMIDAIKSLDDPVSLDNYRAHLVLELKNIKQRGHELEVSPALLDKLCFIWAAYFDERVSYESTLDTTQWQNKTLVSQLFGVRNSGETFFNLIKQLMGFPKKHLALLKVCYVILQLGFKGKYHNHHGAQLKQIIAEINYALSELGAFKIYAEEQPRKVRVFRRRFGLFKGIKPLYFWLTMLLILLTSLFSYNHYLGEMYQQQNLEYQVMADDTYQHLKKLQPPKMFMENTQFFEQAKYEQSAIGAVATVNNEVTTSALGPSKALKSDPLELATAEFNEAPIDTASAAQIVRYLVQIGAFKNRQRAENLQKTCANSQYPLQIIEQQERQLVGVITRGFAQAKTVSDYFTEFCKIIPYIKKYQ